MIEAVQQVSGSSAPSRLVEEARRITIKRIADMGGVSLNPAFATRSTRNVKSILREPCWEVIRHPQYSPNVASSDTLLFANLKEHLKGTRRSIDETKHAASTWCNRQPSGFYMEGLRRWKQRLQKNLDLDGRYVENIFDAIINTDLFNFSGKSSNIPLMQSSDSPLQANASLVTT
ncbi:hypothetical protein M513_02284 [Trichuris suis]|uniref:Mos1 transposase HTH domain-containing protein n=1 Tax=Trichuris suis TaxID=68888 RepID=A0A085MII1_9BILA|nr:hypothetical protein M513_02284 [Trichuris suis]